LQEEDQAQLSTLQHNRTSISKIYLLELLHIHTSIWLYKFKPRATLHCHTID